MTFPEIYVNVSFSSYRRRRQTIDAITGNFFSPLFWLSIVFPRRVYEGNRVGRKDANTEKKNSFLLQSSYFALTGRGGGGDILDYTPRSLGVCLQQQVVYTESELCAHYYYVGKSKARIFHLTPFPLDSSIYYYSPADCHKGGSGRASFFRRALSALGKKGSDGFCFFCSGKEERWCMQQSSVRPPSAPNASAPSSSSSSSSSSFLGGQSLPEDSKERRRRRGAHCYIVMGTWAYTLKIQAKKNSNSQLFFFLWCKKTRKRNQCIIPFAPDLEECKTPGAKIKSFPTLKSNSSPIFFPGPSLSAPKPPPPPPQKSSPRTPVGEK